jgi:hypothetical protein
MHLSGTNLQQYVDCDHEPHVLRALDAHVSNCLHCADAIVTAQAGTVRWERSGLLGRLVRSDAPAPAAAPQAAAERLAA